MIAHPAEIRQKKPLGFRLASVLPGSHRAFQRPVPLDSPDFMARGHRIRIVPGIAISCILFRKQVRINPLNRVSDATKVCFMPHFGAGDECLTGKLLISGWETGMGMPNSLRKNSRVR